MLTKIDTWLLARAQSACWMNPFLIAIGLAICVGCLMYGVHFRVHPEDRDPDRVLTILAFTGVLIAIGVYAGSLNIEKGTGVNPLRNNVVLKFLRITGLFSLAVSAIAFIPVPPDPNPDTIIIALRILANVCFTAMLYFVSCDVPPKTKQT